MPTLTRFRALDSREQAVVAIAVLLDGHDAARYLGFDRDRGKPLSRTAEDLAALTPETRMPLIGTLLRRLIHK